MFADEILDYCGARKLWEAIKALGADSGVTAGSYGPSADTSPAAGGTITVPEVTVNKRGQVTGAANRTVTLPAGGGGGGGDGGWLWNATPAYDETLTEEWFYDDEEGNVFSIPSSVFGDGLSAVLVMVRNAGTTGDLSFVAKNYYFHIDSQGPTFTFVYLPFHGFSLGISFDQDLQGDAIYPIRVSPVLFPPVNGNAPLINSVGITHRSLPAGTNITVYVPA